MEGGLFPYESAEVGSAHVALPAVEPYHSGVLTNKQTELNSFVKREPNSVSLTLCLNLREQERNVRWE